MKRVRRKPVWAVLLLLLGSGAVDASMEAALPQLPQSRLVGNGELTWLGLTVYRAALYAPGGEFQPERPHAIKLAYRFNISRDQLATKSLEEIEHLHGRQSDREQILARLRSVFRDVKPGDQFIGVHYPGRGAEFYGDDGLTGRIEDPELAAALFAVWTSPRTRAPELRRQLLGYRE